ncbi:MAG: glycerophosphodiester phosphodiesterase family protein [Chloroherpetonaceae bacterium]|nr:glycerophosphodiester phosphodiesterase family protein [Chloroherpetonaceae bacterium]
MSQSLKNSIDTIFIRLYIILFRAILFSPFLISTLIFESCTMMNQKPQVKVDFQGHRGARGLLPENTIPAFLKCLDYGLTTLELDVVVSKDTQIVVSHEGWFSSEICSLPNGDSVLKEDEEKFLIYSIPYSEVKKFDCGKRGHPRFPEQQAKPSVKPLLAEVIQASDAYAAYLNLSQPIYNIELKSEPGRDGVLQPEPDMFAQFVYAELLRLEVQNRVIIQSFDPRVLNSMHKIDSTLTYALLVETELSVEENLKSLSFQPKIYSPYFKLVTPELRQTLKSKGIQLVVWTVNELSDMNAMIALGVDGIITDYPNRASQVKIALDSLQKLNHKTN